MSDVIKVSDREYSILEHLADSFYDDVEWGAFYFRSLQSLTKLDRGAVCRTCRALARKGLAAYERALFNEDGEVAGSGYRATQAGKDFVEQRRQKEQHDRELAEQQAPLPV